MNQIYPQISHPLAVGKRVHVMRPSCPCRGAKLEPFEGTIGKVIQNHSGFWYYLTEPGITVRGAWVDAVY